MPNIMSGFGGSAARQIVIRFVADTAFANRKIDDLKKKMTSAGGVKTPGTTSGLASQGMLPGYGPWMLGGGGMDALKKGTKELTEESIKAAKGLNIFGLKLSYAQAGLIAFGYAAYKFVSAIFHYGSLIEQSKMVLTSLYGNENRAVKTIQGMREFSRKTQYLPEEIVGGTTMMAKYNVTPFEKGAYGLNKKNTVMDLMAGLGSMPGMHGPIGLQAAINAVIGGRDIRVMKQFGGDVMAAYAKAKKAGTSASPEYIKVMLTELAKMPKILALANAQLNTMTGMWSTITGYVEEIFMDISGAGEHTGVLTFWSQLKEILMEIRDFGNEAIESMAPFFREFGVFLGAGFKAVFEVIKSAFKILSPFFMILKEVLHIVFQIGTFFLQTFVKALRFVMDMLEKIFKFFGGDNLIKRIVSTLYDFAVGLQVTFKFLGVYIDWIFEKISKGIDRMLFKMNQFLDSIRPILKVFETIMRFLPGGEGIYQAGKEATDPKLHAEKEKWRKENRERISRGLKEIDWGEDPQGGWRSYNTDNYWNQNMKELEKLSKTMDTLTDWLKNSGSVIIKPEEHKNLKKNAPGRFGASGGY